MKNNHSQVIFFIGLLPFVMVLGNSMLIPLLPEIERDLELTNVETGLVLSMFSIPAAIVIPLIGFLSDRFGRKKLILISLVLVIVGSIICGLSSLLGGQSYRFHWLLAGRIVQGIGAGGTTPLAMALVGDIFVNDRSKVLGVLEVYNGIGKVLAPILGAASAIWNWYFAFFILPIIATLSYLGIRRHISSASSEAATMSFREYSLKLSLVFIKKRKLLIPLYVVGGVGLFLLFGVLYFLSFLIEDTYHIDGFFKGTAFIFPLGALTSTSYWTGKRIHKDAKLMKQLFFLGYGLMLVSFFALIFINFFSCLLFFLTLAFGGLGFLLPSINTVITSSVDDGERGFVVSLYGAIRFLGVAIGPIVFGVWMNDPARMFIYCTIILACSFFYLVLSISFQKQHLMKLA
jgi:ACDE family multidrug resistance protein